MKVILTCAGTAGHINPALAIAGELKKLLPDVKLLFIGSGREMENRLIPAAGYKIVNISVSGFARGFAPKQIKHNVGALKNLVVSSRQTDKIIKRFAPDIVVGTGGYVCYPVLKKAAAMGIPTVIHESNAEPGLTARTLSEIVTRVLVAFPETEHLYKKPENVTVTGTPVRSEFEQHDKSSARRELGFDDRPLVVSFWGSLGAARMNEAMPHFVKRNIENRGFRHIHATGGGEKGLAEFKAGLSAAGVEEPYPEHIDIRPYIDDMPKLMAAADIILCRAGASTIAELMLLRKPSVLVPSPYVVANHQEHNARRLLDAGAAEMMLEKDCTGELMYDKVSALLADGGKLAKMQEALGGYSTTNPAAKIAELIISMT